MKKYRFETLDARLKELFSDDWEEKSFEDRRSEFFAAEKLISAVPQEELVGIAAVYAHKYFGMLYAVMQYKQRAKHVSDIANEVVDQNDLYESYIAKVKKDRMDGAAVMLANSAKQKAKAEVKVCWQLWQRHPENYKGKAAFARDMRDKFPNLESQPVIEGWCRAWEREVKPSLS